MPSIASIAAAFATLLVASGCVTSFLSLSDRQQACRVAVRENFGTPGFKANSLSGGAGPLSGAGQGAVMGLQAGAGGILLMPIAALIGAGYGTSCAVAASQHPTANADFERLLRESDSGVVRRTVEAKLAAPRAECAATMTDAATTPDAFVEIDRIQAGMACLHGRQEFWVEVKWRTVTARSGKVLNEATARREMKSPLAVAEWFARPDAARGEIETVFAFLGQDIAYQFVAEAPAMPDAGTPWQKPLPAGPNRPPPRCL
jgi:hypothetical protein